MRHGAVGPHPAQRRPSALALPPVKKPKARKTIQLLLQDAVSDLPLATAAFLKLVTAARDDRPSLAEGLHTVETTADSHYLELVHTVGSAFITPYDREDLYAMVEALDDVIDMLDHAGGLLARFDLDDLPPEVVDNARALHEMALVSQHTVDLIKKPAKLEQALVECNALENAMDSRYRDLLVRILEHEDARYAIKVKILADSMEEAANRLDRFGRAVGLIAIKET